MESFHPIRSLADWLTFSLFGLEKQTTASEVVNFFIYDALKIILLLLLVNYLMAVIRHYLPVRKIKEFLAGRRRRGAGYLLAALFGAVTPFCSCSSIPIFIGFLEAGIPLGITLSFLIVSPLVNQVALVLLAGLFGWQITLLYLGAAVLLGVVGGYVLSRFKLEKYVADYVWEIKATQTGTTAEKLSLKEWLQKICREGNDLTWKVVWYVLGGLMVGALIHGYVPAGFFERYIGLDNILAVPMATIVAVPMYANAVGVIPIMQSLVEKGIPLGTALAFMMAVVGLSLPEALILKRVMKLKLLIYFFGLTSLNIMIVGYLINLWPL